MNKISKLFSATFISVLVGGSLFLISVLFDLDIFEVFVASLENAEHLEIDEIILPLFIFLTGVVIDISKMYIRKRKAALIAATKLEALQTTIRTVQDIVGNSMNNLILYSTEAKQTGSLSENSIKELDVLIQSTSKQISELTNVKQIHEKEIGDGMYVIDMNAKNEE